jgi:adenylosuccinate synthase
MAVVAVVGAQWGDEGKGQVIDVLAEKARIVARYQGGSNAGHTVVNQLGHFRLHLVPSGIFHPETICIIGNGVVVDPAVLLQEIEALQQHHIDTSRLYVSDRAHVVLPYHLVLDRLADEARGEQRIGTTGRGIGPAYEDKVARIGLRMGDLLDADLLREKLRFLVEYKNKILACLYNAPPFSFAELYDTYRRYGERLAPHITDTFAMIHAAIRRGDNILLEGAQATLLDLDFGTYPYVTASSPTVGGACTGLGIGPRLITRAIGVFKAYYTRVGSGPFPTELTDATGDLIRERGREYGTTTGRPRRCGWFDAVLARYAVQLNGLDGFALNALSVLDPLPVVKICTAYRYGDQVLDLPPASLSVLSQCVPIYEELPGWQEPIGHIRRYGDLPANARRFVERIAELINCRLDMLAVGLKREQVITLHPAFD